MCQQSYNTIITNCFSNSLNDLSQTKTKIISKIQLLQSINITPPTCPSNTKTCFQVRQQQILQLHLISSPIQANQIFYSRVQTVRAAKLVFRTNRKQTLCNVFWFKPHSLPLSCISRLLVQRRPSSSTATTTTTTQSIFVIIYLFRTTSAVQRRSEDKLPVRR